MGPQAGCVRHPFHCWASFRTSENINFMTERSSPWGYTGGKCPGSTSPVSLLVVDRAHLADTLLDGKPTNRRNTQKTLEWPTISGGNAETDGFDNLGFIHPGEILLSGCATFVTFNPESEKQAARDRGVRGVGIPLSACQDLKGVPRHLRRGWDIPVALVREDSLCRNCWTF